MEPLRCPVVELRQYTLHPGRRDALIDLFDREFVEPQEAVGMTVLGQFRNLDWFGRFPDEAHIEDHLTRLRNSRRRRDELLPVLAERWARSPEQLRLAPTNRSALH